MFKVDCPKRADAARQRTGATAVEFAIVAPVILLLFLGAVELLSLNFIKHTAANAAYEGARAAIVAQGDEHAAAAHARDFLNLFGVGNGADVSIEGAVDQVMVTVRIPTNLNSYGLSRFTKNIAVTQICTLSREIIAGEEKQ